MNPSTQCHFCGSKGKRPCPAVGGMICPHCCGSKRGSEIFCPSDCYFYPFGPAQYDSFLAIEASFDRKSLEYIVRYYGKDKWYETLDRMAVSESDTESGGIIAAGAAAYYLLFHEKNDSGRTLAEEWEKENCSGLNNDERIILKARKNSSATVIEIQKLLDHQTMECIDLFNQSRSPFSVIDRRTAAQMPRFTRILTWIDDYPYFSRLGAGGIVISDILRREGMEIIEKIVKRRGKPDEKTVKRYLSENFGEAAHMLTELAFEKTKAMFRSMDVHECIATYDIVREPDKIKEILDTYPEFQREEECEQHGTVEYTWLRIGRSKAIEKSMFPLFRHKEDEEMVGTLGKIRVYSDRLEVEAFSKQKYEFAKKMAEKYFGSKICLKRESVVDLAKQVAEREREDFEEDEDEDSEAEMPESIPLELRQTVMAQFFREHYTKFLDDSVPALKGMSPREAAKDPAMRPALLELMKEHIRGIENQNKKQGLQISLDWVLEELGLLELKSP
ncbi:MAG: hypothetical protein HYZ85_02035 [Candidatus Omnitrophica bacterium]|nr:hypothetical protein [Candidatus Omnitrophota bacterium]